ncbi:beta-ketoacyl synthase [Kitasatospora sp. NRRL B-11411]|uniref:beta-ketoacyl-[acyl-carrier-protein] synthase family protein n=1 Tax=Kitasatospora sp. NRRL B-11411 TaxID=1463822 RepID=UPI000690FB5C|nr:beta-ketoacyl-[acyl-carrier-protein] synthase family protein [Kitasatospora sp. NRRL B-11411]
MTDRTERTERADRADRARIVVTGTGAVTAGGAGMAATWRTLCEGRGTARYDPALDGTPVPISCRPPHPEDAPVRQGWRLDRSTRYLLTAAQEALREAGIEAFGPRPPDWDPARVAVVVGSAAGGVAVLEDAHRRLLDRGPDALSPLTLTGYLPNLSAAGHLALALRTTGPALHTSTACASGANAIAHAALLLATGACDLAVTGGTDAMATPLCAAAFARTGALSRRTDRPATASRPFDRDRDGFVLGEGAGVLVLERAADAAARGAPALAHLAGWATTSDAHHPTAPDPAGRGLRAAVALALRAADAAPGEVEHVNAHGTGTPRGDRAEAAAIRDLFARTPPSVTSAKGALGHTMGAAGAIEAALTVRTLRTGTAPPTANHDAPGPDTAGIDLVTGRPRDHGPRLALSHSLGFGGHNTVLALRRTDAP